MAKLKLISSTLAKIKAADISEGAIYAATDEAELAYDFNNKRYYIPGVPESTVADADKILTVDSAGASVWANVPTATNDTLGVVKAGENVTIGEDGAINAKGGNSEVNWNKFFEIEFGPFDESVTYKKDTYVYLPLTFEFFKSKVDNITGISPISAISDDYWEYIGIYPINYIPTTSNSDKAFVIGEISNDMSAPMFRLVDNDELIATTKNVGFVKPGTTMNIDSDGFINANIATSSSAGIIKPGDSFSISDDGTINYTGSEIDWGNINPVVGNSDNTYKKDEYVYWFNNDTGYPYIYNHSVYKSLVNDNKVKNMPTNGISNEYWMYIGEKPYGLGIDVEPETSDNQYIMPVFSIGYEKMDSVYPMGAQLRQPLEYAASTHSIVINPATDNQMGAVMPGTGMQMEKVQGYSTSMITLKPATIDTIGGVKIGDGLSIDDDGTLSVSGGSDYFTVETVKDKSDNDVNILKTTTAILPFEWGEGTLSIKSYNCKSSGVYTYAEGWSTQATANYASHAEGTDTTASGNYSHAEGSRTTASGNSAHAEGYSCIASGNYSHAEGEGSAATGHSAHSECTAMASGICSHAEGFDCESAAYCSHAEGFQTCASSIYQHVQGKYNIKDTEGKYAHIVGNGDSSTNERSNAHTLDWNGNSWYAGEVTATDNTGASHNLTEKANASEVDTILATKAASSHTHEAADITSVNASAITGTISASNLPSFVDDVLEYSGKSNFPPTGETGKIYVDTATNLTYRWSGSAYVEISPSIALGETSSTAYRGDYGAAAYSHAVTNKGTSLTSGLYKITVNSEGHVTAGTAVTKSDITALGIPASDTNTDTKVTQTVTTTNAAYPILLAPTGQTATTTTTSYFDSGVTLNPSTNTIAANISGNAATATSATKLATARTISLTGGVTGSGTFDGSGDLSITTTAAPIYSAGTSAPSNTNLLWIDTTDGAVMKYYDTTSKAWKAVSAVWG